MPDLDANSNPNGLAGAGTGGGVKPGEPEGGLAVAMAAMERSSLSSLDAHTAGGARAPRLEPTAAAASSSGGPAHPGAADAHAVFVGLRYLDLVLVALATPVALALGAPVLGYCIGAGAWALQRIIAHADRRWIRKAAEPRTQLGLALFEAFGRIWLLAGAIVVAGAAGSRANGLTAALTIFGAYSVAFAVKVIAGPPQRRALR
jgi:hypothetical protein